MIPLTAQEIDHLNRLNTKTMDMRLGAIVQSLIQHVNADLPIGQPDEYVDETAGSPVNAVNAKNTLTLSGVVKHGEKIVIDNPEMDGVDVYEFLADTAQKKTLEAHIAVNIATPYTTKSYGTLVVEAQPTSGDTMTIGDKVYTFVPVGTNTADAEIPIGTDLATAQAAIVAAINGTDGINDPHPLVKAGDFTANASTITCLIGGTDGDEIATTETFTAGANVFADLTLGGGSDCTAANAITALVAAITASDTQGVGAADGTGDTVDLTADVAGVVGNAIIVQESLANGAFAGGAELLSGGVDGTEGVKFQCMMDSQYLYYCIANNSISGKNWRRISLGTAY